jgi:hypothetical protein
MNNDLTIIYITNNLMPKVWVDFQISSFIKASEGFNVISVSRKPMDLGTNLIDSEPQSYWNIYYQLMRAAKIADTDFIATAEDDTLYTHEHYQEFRPKLDEIAYDRSRWSLFSWDKNPIYCLRNRVSNCAMISPRQLFIDAIEERIEKYPKGLPNSEIGEVGRERVELRLKVKRNKLVEFYCSNSIVQLNHINGSDIRQKEKWKSHAQIKAYDIPTWGKAYDIVQIFNKEN